MDAMADLFAGQRCDAWARHTVAEVEQQPPGPVFFAIKPDTDAARDAEQTARRLRAENGLTGVPLPPDLLHVSLAGVGLRPGLRPEVVEAACAAASAVTMPPFAAAFDRAASFGGDSLVLFGGDGVVGIEMLRRALISGLEKAGLAFKRKAYEPHMTLLYDRRRVSEQFIAPVRWSVREFVLVHGLHGLARHACLARWKLSG